MSKAYLFKIKAGKKEQWYSWCNELATTLQSEAVLTLKEERVTHELAMGFNLPYGDYFVGYMDGECLPANIDREINQKHNAIKL